MMLYIFVAHPLRSAGLFCPSASSRNRDSDGGRRAGIPRRRYGWRPPSTGSCLRDARPAVDVDDRSLESSPEPVPVVRAPTRCAAGRYCIAPSATILKTSQITMPMQFSPVGTVVHFWHVPDCRGRDDCSRPLERVQIVIALPLAYALVILAPFLAFHSGIV